MRNLILCSLSIFCTFFSEASSCRTFDLFERSSDGNIELDAEGYQKRISPEAFRAMFPEIKKFDVRDGKLLYDTLIACENNEGSTSYVDFLYGPGYLEDLGKGKYIALTGEMSLFIDANNFSITRLTDEGYGKNDNDRLFVSCTIDFDYPLLKDEIVGLYDQLQSFRMLLSEKRSNNNCDERYEVSRSFNEIYKDLSPDPRVTEALDPIRDPYYYSRVTRYIAYLNKYPLTKKTEERYTQMSAWLLGYSLYNEAILLATNITAFNPDSINGFMILGDAYYALGQAELAKPNYKKVEKLAKKYNSEIPDRVLERI